MDVFNWLLSYASSTGVALYGLCLPPNERKLISVVFVLSSVHNLYLTTKLDLYTHLKGIACFSVIFLFYHVTSMFWIHNIATCETWLSAYKMVYNGRWVGTYRSPIQSGCYNGRLCYRKSSEDTNKRGRASEAHKCQSRVQFVRSRISIIVQIYAFMFIYNELIDLEGRINTIATDFSTKTPSFWRRYLMSGRNGMNVKRELMVRMHLGFDWIFQTASEVIGAHEFLAAIFVLLGIDEPDEWPPLFGNPTTIISLRTFYADFWHHLHYRSYVDYSRCILKLLGVRGTSQVTKLSLILLVFAISGFNHAVNDYISLQGSFPLRKWMTYWIIQAVLIIFEDCVKVAYRKLAGRIELTSPAMQRRRQMERSIARIWVFLVFFLILSKVHYDMEAVSQ